MHEELRCDWSKVKGEFASNRNVRENNVYKDQNTVGSRGVATSWQYLQQAGASARVRLVQAAAKIVGMFLHPSASPKTVRSCTRRPAAA